MSPLVVRTSSPAGRADVAWVRFDSGREHNHMTAAVIDELSAALGAVTADPAVGTIVIGAMGEDFSAGAEAELIRGTDLAEAERFVDAEYELFALVEGSPAVTVALVDGYCLGNGAELSLACDFRIAGPRLRWGYPEARLGLMSPVSRLVRQVPRGTALRLAFGGAWLDTEGARGAGVAEAVVDDVTDEAQVLEALGSLSRATPAGARWTKQALRDAAAGCFRERELAVASLAEMMAAPRPTDDEATGHDER